MVKVVLDLRMVRGPLHGIARYALELARRLPGLAPSWQFSALVPPEGLPDELGALSPRIPQVRAPSGFLSALEQPGLATTLLRERPALFHATSFSVPLLWPGRLVATLHDATHLALPENASAVRKGYYRLVVKPRCERAKALITVSEFSRGELARHLGFHGERLQVIPNGVDAAFQRAPQADVDDFRARRGLPARYLVAIGNPKPHKNLAVLAQAANEFPEPLVLLAGRGAKRELRFPDRVLELSPVSDDELVRLISGATAVLLPSRYEGFGLPALEAMACGVPVIAANAGAFPEVVGAAGVLVSPSSARDWTNAVGRLCRDERQRAGLVSLGLERAARFTWDDCARQTLAVYRRALEAR